MYILKLDFKQKNEVIGGCFFLIFSHFICHLFLEKSPHSGRKKMRKEETNTLKRLILNAVSLELLA